MARLIDGTGAARRATPARANRALSAADAAMRRSGGQGGGLIPHRDPPAA